MYKARCTTKKNSDGEEYTLLRARFRFKRGVAPKDRKVVKQRIDVRGGGGALKGYLVSVEGCKYQEENSSNSNANFIADTKEPVYSRFIDIYLHTWGLGFNIDVSCSGAVPLEEMLDLGALNRFVITGQMPKKKKQPSKKKTK